MSDMRSRARKDADEAKRKLRAQYRAMPGGSRDMNSLTQFVTMRDDERYDGLAEGLVMVTFTHSNLKAKHVDIKIDNMSSVWDVKMKMSKHCGTPARDMEMHRMSNGQVVCKLDDDSRPFGFYSVENGDTIHIVDTNPHSLSAGGGLEDTSLVKKYVMSDEEYNKRKNTLRAYKREQMKQDPNFKFDFNKGKKAGAGGPGGLAAVAEKENMYGAESVEGITVGSRCQVQPGSRRGEVKFVGEVAGIAPGNWVGVQFDEPVGKSNGTIKGKQYFEAPSMYGGFVRPDKIECGDFPEEDLFDDSDEDSDEEL